MCQFYPLDKVIHFSYNRGQAAIGYVLADLVDRIFKVFILKRDVLKLLSCIFDGYF